MQEAGFELSVEVSSNETQTYFCAVPNHCQKGMFGLINVSEHFPHCTSSMHRKILRAARQGLTVAVPEGSFGEAMPIMAAK